MKWTCAILLLFLSLTVFAQDKPHSVSKQDQKMAAERFKRALELRKDGKVEDALLAATDASRLVPSNTEYMLTREMLRQQIVGNYLNKGNALAALGNNKAAAEQFKEALARDPQNSYVQQRLRDVTDDNADQHRVMELLAGVNSIDLQPLPGKKSIHAGPDMRSVYTKIGQVFGVTFDFDQSVTSRQLRLDLDDVDFYTVTDLLGKMTKTFWAPVSSKEAIVANDTQDMRTAYERMAVRTFYVANVTSQTDLTDLANMMRVIFDMKFVSVDAGHSTITVRAPKDQVDAVARFIDNVMDAKPEIMLVVNEYEFDTDKLLNYGLNLPTDFTVFNIPSEIRRVLGGDAQAVIDALNKNGTIDPSQIPAGDLANLQGSPLLQPFIFFGKGLGLTGIIVSPVSGQLAATHSSSSTLEHVNLRAIDAEPATVRVGTKFPVVTANFSTVAVSASGVSNAAVTPQFQFVDLGLTLKVTPHWQSAGDIKLDLELEIQGLGAQTLNGIPEITSRSFKGNITARQGEPSVIGGSITDQELRSTRGYPGIGQLPLLRNILNTNSSDRSHNEILFVVTPYVIRKPFHDHGASALWSVK